MYVFKEKIKVFTVLTGVVLLLGACGGGGSDAPAAVVPGVSVSTVGKLLTQTQVDSIAAADVTGQDTGKALFVAVDANGNVSGKSSGAETIGLKTGFFQGQAGAMEVTSGSTTTGAIDIVTGRGLGAGAGKAQVDIYTTGVNVASEAAFGIIETTGAAGGVVVGGFHAGNETTTASMPANATATYAGAFTGRVLRNEANGDVIYQSVGGGMSMTADFGAGTVDGRSSEIAGTEVVIHGSISGNTYSGTGRMVATGTNTTLGTVNSSAMNGGFYGAGASQTAGAVTISQDINGGTTTVIGAFGGEKQ